MSLLNNLINGISLGSVYAIIALGYTMVYGIAKMLNFAHGDIIMVGAYVCFFATGQFGLSAIGVSYFLQNSALLLWKSDPKVFTSVVPGGSLTLGSVNITYVSLVTVLSCVVIMLVLSFFTGHTKMGKAMRACSEDKAAAQLMGIDVNRTISMTFAIGSALAAVAGGLLCSTYPTLMPTTGSLPGIKAFTAAVFGGIGSIPGAMLGGILLGIIEIFAKAFNTNISDAVVFAVLIVVLLVKPSGLLGKTVREKV